MQNQKEIAKINRFVSLVLPIIVNVVRTILQAFKFQVNEEGCGLDLAFLIKSGEKEVRFFMHNLLMEIATVDRDEIPLRFDENLRDFDFFLAKMVRLTQSKLKILFHFFGADNIDAAIENIVKDSKQYERIRIWQFDQNSPCKDEAEAEGGSGSSPDL